MKILELSGGTRGLRETILDLANDYGPDTSFVERTFFDEFAERSYPAVLPIFEDHVRGTETLPMAEYYAKIGIEYVPAVNTGEQVTAFGLQLGLDGTNLAIIGRDEIAASCGLEVGDHLIGFNGMEVTLQTVQQAFAGLGTLGAGEEFTIKVRRSGEERELTCAKRLVDRIERHIFRVDPDATPEQVALRRAWMKNF